MGNLNSCFTEVHEPETLRMLSGAKEREEKKQQTGRKKKKIFQNRNSCIFTLRCSSRGVKIITLNLKTSIDIALGKNGQADIRGI